MLNQRAQLSVHPGEDASYSLYADHPAVRAELATLAAAEAAAHPELEIAALLGDGHLILAVRDRTPDGPSRALANRSARRPRPGRDRRDRPTAVRRGRAVRLSGSRDRCGDAVGPQRVDLGAQVVGGSVVDQDDVGDGAALLVGGLRGHPRPHVLRRHAAVRGQPLHPPLLRRLHDDDKVVRPGLFGLDQQRHVLHDDRAGRSGRDQSGALARTRGCTIALSRPRAASSPKTSLGQRRAVEPAVASSTCSPNSATTAASPSVPGSTTSRASASASITSAPSSANRAAAVDLPDPIPPVNPICTARPYGVKSTC
jgi:hypothetical protein